MAPSIWTGSLSFGLVNVPVGIYSATREHEVRSRQFQQRTSSRIRSQRVNEDTGEEVEYDDIVKGAEIGDDEYVIITPEELESVEPGRSRTIDITDFVEAAGIDPIHRARADVGREGRRPALRPPGLDREREGAPAGQRRPRRRAAHPEEGRLGRGELSKDELDELAKGLGVKGRPTMSTTQLRKAVEMTSCVW